MISYWKNLQKLHMRTISAFTRLLFGWNDPAICSEAAKHQGRLDEDTNTIRVTSISADMHKYGYALSKLVCSSRQCLLEYNSFKLIQKSIQHYRFMQKVFL
ncbi:hypothetical protein ACHAWO_008709 [Cyclotella atomus]|uniref:Uncharacterized protein n=1 Tax=Cyclotella atomus TaxID=382360 RepID=A0ABD3NBX7_9STRA